MARRADDHPDQLVGASPRGVILPATNSGDAGSQGMTRYALVLLALAGASGCLVRARPVIPLVRVAPAHVHFKGCGHHVKAVVVVR